MLSVSGLTVRVQQRRVLDKLSFQVEAGHKLAVIGSNGSGKSTLLRALAGLLPYTGSVTVDARPLRTPDPARVALLPQRPSLAFDLSVAQLVGLGGPHVGEALLAVALDGKRSMRTLSGGEQQRAHLGRCLAAAPKLLLLDEPTNHLDPGARAALLRVLRGRACVIATHDLEIAARADHVLMLRTGHSAAFGPPHAVLHPDCLAEVFGTALRRVDDPVDGHPMFRLSLE